MLPGLQEKMVAVGMVVGLGPVLVVVVKEMKARFASEESERDRQQALRDPRREQVQQRLSGGFWRRAERRAFGLLKLGEAKRSTHMGAKR